MSKEPRNDLDAARIAVTRTEQALVAAEEVTIAAATAVETAVQVERKAARAVSESRRVHHLAKDSAGRALDEHQAAKKVFQALLNQK